VSRELAPDEVIHGGWHRRVTLRDGTEVLLRQIRPADASRLADGLEQLSPESRYLRFHREIDHLTDEQLRDLTDVDHIDHEAIVAVDLSLPGTPGIGVARYIREPYERDVAESAITVLDSYHGRGVGTVLLGAIASRARTNGITVFRSYVLEGNQAMLEVFDHLGARRQPETSGVWRVDLDLPDSDADLPGSPAGRAFHEVATTRRRLASMFPPIWSKRPAPEPRGPAEDG
jgi:GNAT superfamily N-acetyltransferase